MSLELQRAAKRRHVVGQISGRCFSSWKEIGFHYPKQSCCGFFKVVKNRRDKTSKIELPEKGRLVRPSSNSRRETP